jgi:hypothetical protein
MIVRMRFSGSCEIEPSVAGSKQTTSQRPYDGRMRPKPSPAVSSSPIAGPNDGERFSNTATSYIPGTSEGLPGDCGASGSWSAGGRNTRFCRAAATVIQSPVSTSWRMVAVSGRGPRWRSSISWWPVSADPSSSK